MTQKTIIISINTSWNIFNFRVGLLKALQDEGYHIVCVAPRDEYSERLEALGFEYREIKMNNKGTSPKEDLKLIYDYYRCYKAINPDVILHYTIKPNIYGSIAGAMLGIKMISNISGLGTVFLNEGVSSRIAKILYKIALKFPQKVFFQNADDRELFITQKLVKADKTDILAGSGIDTQKFRPLADNRSMRSEKLTFLFIARLVKDKGLVEYVEASKQVGQGHRYEILGAYYSDNPTAITPHQMHQWEEEGVVTYLGVSDDVASVIGLADCVVLPSYREGLSRVLLESASLEKPLITTNVAGCKEVVDDGVNGFLCEVKSADSLAIQMQKMIDLSQEERETMGKKGREKVIREFDERRVIEKYLGAIG